MKLIPGMKNRTFLIILRMTMMQSLLKALVWAVYRVMKMTAL